MNRYPNFAPYAILVASSLAVLPFVGNPTTWATLLFAGVAMGLIVFVAASGLTLVYGLMDVLQFGHGLFIALGAYLVSALLRAGVGTVPGSEVLTAVLSVTAAGGCALAAGAALGFVFERVLIRPAYGNHLKQILVTTGGMIIGVELLKAMWGADDLPVPLPALLQGSVTWGGVVIEKIRLLAVAVGGAIFVLLGACLRYTRIGLLIRAGVQDKDMVKALGYRIDLLFIAVFVVGSALAGLGGVLWGLYQQTISSQVGNQLNVLIFVVIVMGGLGSITGSLLAAIAIGVLTNFTGYLAPKVGLFSTIALMTAVLLWRPEGLLRRRS